MKKNIQKILEGCVIDTNQIYQSKYASINPNHTEIKFRSKIAQVLQSDPLLMVANSHSITVMDAQVNDFLGRLPEDCIILDIGGCWGWHWRGLESNPNGPIVVIIDFVYENLLIARKVLGHLIKSHNVFLVCADATSLPFEAEVFDGVWSVQCLQHIQNIEPAFIEANRVLVNGGYFINYSLNYQPPIKFIYKIFGLHYPDNQNIDGQYYLARASKAQLIMIEKIFHSPVTEGWTEIIFKPELLFSTSGLEGSVLGWLDSRLSKFGKFFKWIARQHSMCVRKNDI